MREENIYSGHENEAAGDHVQNDPDGVCNFGVMKNGVPNGRIQRTDRLTWI